MAITDLQPDAAVLCPNEEQVITATIIQSDPPQSVVWTIDGEPAHPHPNDPPTVLRVRGRAQTKRIAASHAGSSRSVSVTWKEARLEVRTDPATAAISDEPRMPTITFTAIGIGGAAAVSQWEVTAGAQDFSDCPPHGPDVDFLHREPTQGGGSQISVMLDVIRGFSVNARATGSVNGCPVDASGVCSLSGTNPLRSDVQRTLPHDTLRRIACRESQQRQFDAPADSGTAFCPLFGPGGKTGIMQIPNPTADEAWNWRLNVEKGIEIFNERVDTARDYPNRVRNSAGFQDLVNQFNQRRQQQGLNPLQIALPDFTTGNFDDNLQQLELDAIRGYNGWFGSDRFGFELHEFRVAIDFINGDEVLQVTNIDEQAGTGEAVWKQVPVGDRPRTPGDLNYVNNVLAWPAACLLAPPPASTMPRNLGRGGCQ